VTGALLATGAIFTGLALHGHDPATVDALLVQPAVLSVPGAFAVMVAASWFDRRPRVEPEILALHAPEGLRLGLEEALAGEPVADGGATVGAAPPRVPLVSDRSRAD
jgi:hypothetical protein